MALLLAWMVARPPTLPQRKKNAHMKIGFIGLGQMGRGMAARLVDKGHEVVAWNRSAGPAEALREHGARIAASAAEALHAEVVITMLADDAAVEAVWIEGGLISRMAAE